MIKIRLLSHKLRLLQDSATVQRAIANTNASNLCGSTSGPKRDPSYRPQTQTKKVLHLPASDRDTAKSNGGPVALIWAVTGEPSRRWNFAGFNLTDRHYKLLPEEGHFMVPWACKKQNKGEVGEKEAGSWSPGEKKHNDVFCMLWSMIHRQCFILLTSAPHIFRLIFYLSGCYLFSRYFTELIILIFDSQIFCKKNITRQNWCGCFWFWFRGLSC